MPQIAVDSQFSLSRHALKWELYCIFRQLTRRHLHLWWTTFFLVIRFPRGSKKTVPCFETRSQRSTEPFHSECWMTNYATTSSEILKVYWLGDGTQKAPCVYVYIYMYRFTYTYLHTYIYTHIYIYISYCRKEHPESHLYIYMGWPASKSGWRENLSLRSKNNHLICIDHTVDS